MAEWLYFFCALVFSDCQSPDIAAPLPDKATTLGQRLIAVNSNLTDETSGMAASHQRENILWLHNDSGDQANLYAVNSQNGALLQTVNLNGAEAEDWEDIASFQQQGRTYLLLGDIGDNFASRNYLTLYATLEPTAAQNRSEVAWAVNFQYEDGPRDSESLAVDALNQEILILSKRDKPPRLYSLALPTGGNIGAEPRTARFLGAVTTIPKPSQADLEEDPRWGAYRDRPTAMDISPNGLHLVIATNKDSYIYRRHTDGWSAALQQQPTVIDTPQMAQTEAAGFSGDGKGLWVGSEQLPTQLFYTPIDTH